MKLPGPSYPLQEGQEGQQKSGQPLPQLVASRLVV
jgi:hypothetical protein